MHLFYFRGSEKFLVRPLNWKSTFYFVEYRVSRHVSHIAHIVSPMDRFRGAMKTGQTQLARAIGAAVMRSVWDWNFCRKRVFIRYDLEIQSNFNISASSGSRFFGCGLHGAAPDRFWSGFGSDSRISRGEHGARRGALRRSPQRPQPA